jgi:ABC-type cobalamin transport system ATPase subunit
MLNHLLEEWTEAGRSVVMTTHNLELGLSWADRVAVLAEGKLHFQESVEYLDAANLRQMRASPSSAAAKRPLETRP